MDDPANLDFSRAEMERMGEIVLERCLAHLESLPDQPSCGDVDAAALCRAIERDAPEDGRALEGLLARLFDDWIPRSFNTAGPGYLAYVPGGGIFPAALADLISNTTNRFVGVWQAAPALATLEARVLDWIRDWMGFPETTRGLLLSGSSLCSLSALVTAREWLLGADIRSGVLYGSEELHHSVRKAARIAGIQDDRIRLVPVDAQYRMRVDALRAAVAEDRKRGLRPFVVVSSAGTINTGSIDPLAAIGEVCREFELWHHVDGAYGGFFHLVPELRPRFAGLEHADSIALDPHKGLFLPYGTGAVLVRDGHKLHAAHAATASYLPNSCEDDTEDVYDISMYGPELSRPFRGLRVWLAVQLFGVRKIRAAIAEKRELAVWAHDQLSKVPSLRIVAPPELSLFAFHVTKPGASLETENEATRRLVANVTRRGKVMLSSCISRGRVFARICVISFRTRRDRIELAVEHIREEAGNKVSESFFPPSASHD